MAINKNSNAYIIIYTVVMVVIVGSLLAFLATSLKDKQAANILNEQKVSIMKAFGEANEKSEKEDVVKMFDESVTIMTITDGEAVEAENIQAVFDLLGNRKALGEAKNNLPLFVLEKDDTTKYVLPLVGKGLWGDIWGYVALQQTEDNNLVISGIVMDHAGETPGLGAEIATAKWQKKFQGKVLYDAEGNFAVRMQKGGAKNEHQVDAITGGTKTCDGVNAMLETSIQKYKSFLVDEADAFDEDTCCGECEGACCGEFAEDALCKDTTCKKCETCEQRETCVKVHCKDCKDGACCDKAECDKAECDKAECDKAECTDCKKTECKTCEQQVADTKNVESKK